MSFILCQNPRDPESIDVITKMKTLGGRFEREIVFANLQVDFLSLAGVPPELSDRITGGEDVEVKLVAV